MPHKAASVGREKRKKQRRGKEKEEERKKKEEGEFDKMTIQKSFFSSPMLCETRAKMEERKRSIF